MTDPVETAMSVVWKAAWRLEVRRSRRMALAAFVIGLLLGVLVTRAVLAETPRSAQPVIADWQWQQVAPATAGRTEAPPVGDSPALPPIVDPFPVSPSPERAAVEVPAAELVVREKATPRPAAGAGVSGIASYYAWHVGEAAAGPALRVGNWRGRVVTVCTSSCIAVRLTDFCQCYGSRVIDLDTRSFAALAPLSAGLVTVRVSW